MGKKKISYVFTDEQLKILEDTIDTNFKAIMECLKPLEVYRNKKVPLKSSDLLDSTKK